MGNFLLAIWVRMRLRSIERTILHIEYRQQELRGELIEWKALKDHVALELVDVEYSL